MIASHWQIVAGLFCAQSLKKNLATFYPFKCRLHPLNKLIGEHTLTLIWKYPNASLFYHKI
jgi:hypothetical protein